MKPDAAGWAYGTGGAVVIVRMGRVHRLGLSKAAWWRQEVALLWPF